MRENANDEKGQREQRMLMAAAVILIYQRGRNKLRMDVKGCRQVESQLDQQEQRVLGKGSSADAKRVC